VEKLNGCFYFHLNFEEHQKAKRKGKYDGESILGENKKTHKFILEAGKRRRLIFLQQGKKKPYEQFIEEK